VHLLRRKKRFVFAGIVIQTRRFHRKFRRKKSPDGAIIDYYLASSSNQPVTLEIFDEQQHFVRRYSSADKPEPVEKTAAEHPIPMYWVRPTQILSAVAGMHRFAWTCTTTPGISRARISNFRIVHDTPKYPLGAWIVPGITP